MIIFVSVKFEKRKERLEKIDERNYQVFVKAEPKDGKANKEVVKEVGRYFNVEPKSVKIILGGKKRKKVLVVRNIDKIE